MNTEKLSVQIQGFEEALLHTDHSSDSSLIKKLLAPNFEEISPTGEVHGRDLVVQWLLKKDIEARWLLKNFSLTVLSQDLLLVKYQAKQIAPTSSTSKGSMRSSLWKMSASEGCWQMLFHQATKILYVKFDSLSL